MTSTITSLARFQLNYLKKLVANIPDDRLYEKQLDGYNSAGWILGHIYVEADDVLNFLNIPYEQNDLWKSLFYNTAGRLQSLDNVPEKGELVEKLYERYDQLIDVYENLSTEQRSAPHPSKMVKDILPNVDAWFAHHITTHISIHCGNLVVWKKMIGLEVGGY